MQAAERPALTVKLTIFGLLAEQMTNTFIYFIYYNLWHTKTEAKG